MRGEAWRPFDVWEEARRSSSARRAPLAAAAFDEAEAPHPFCWPVRGRGGKFEVDEIGAAARGSGVAGVPDGAVAGEMGEELHHRDFRAVFGGEPGEAIGALSRATSTGDPDDDVGVGGEDIRARHEQKDITRTYGREKVVGAWAPALAIEAEGGDARAAPFTRARSALNAETPNRRRSDRRPLDLRPAKRAFELAAMSPLAQCLKLLYLGTTRKPSLEASDVNMNVSLPEELANFVKDKVSTGRYGSSSEVVREALRLMEKTEQQEAEKLCLAAPGLEERHRQWGRRRDRLQGFEGRSARPLGRIEA